MKIEKTDLLTPANVATLTGLILTVTGSAYLDHWFGAALIAAGRGLDLIDGPLARKYHASRFGAAMDGTADKLATFIILLGVLYFKAAPLVLVLYVFLQNVINMLITLYAEHKKRHPESSLFGKRGMFFQNCSVILFAFASTLENPNLVNMLQTSGVLTVLVGLPLSLMGTYGYLQVALGYKKH